LPSNNTSARPRTTETNNNMTNQRNFMVAVLNGTTAALPAKI
jgi:hypothetical protein